MIFFISVALGPADVFAHPGRTDSSGCHTCRTNCSSWGLSSGEYHCHRAKALPQPEPPIKSTFGENGTGYIQPAPEYEKPSVPISKNTNLSIPTSDNINPSVLVQKNTNKSQANVNQSIQSQSKKGFWQWLFDLFR